MRSKYENVPTDQPLRALHIPAEDRTLVPVPRLYQRDPESYTADVGEVRKSYRPEWFAVTGKPTTLTYHQPDKSIIVEHRLKDGVSIPGEVLPPAVSGFIDDGCVYFKAEADAPTVDERWQDMYDTVTRTETVEPLTWMVECRDITFGPDDDRLIDTLDWSPDATRIPPTSYDEDGAAFTMWLPGYVTGAEAWIGRQLEEMRLDGVLDVYTHRSLAINVKRPIPGAVHRQATYDARGRKKRGTREVPAYHTVRIEPTIPRYVTGEDFLDACLKVRAILGEIVADIEALGPLTCPTCKGAGYIQGREPHPAATT